MVGKQISHYRILEKLGQGGMGTVYKAQDTKLDRFVALKFLPPHLSQAEEEKKRFIHEAKAASALDHPNICTVYEIDETADGQMFIAMACYEGESLKDKIERGPLPIDEAIDIGIQVAQGLAKAHSKEIIHRDIKPANILVTEDGVVKIVDFGLAKLAGRTMLTKEGTTLGTVAYMSPEQAQGAKVHHHTDIWALGVVLYEMLIGEQPFKGDYEQAVVYSIMNEDPEPITNLRSDIPTDLQNVVQKAMQKDASERYQQVKELRAELKSIKKKLESKKVDVAGEEETSLPSIAVLPFVNMSADPENEYFSDGLSEELINALTKLERLHVVARTSAFRFRGKEVDIRDVGKQLNVSSVLEGSVRKVGNRLRITAQLINVADGYHLWSERYDREMSDIFAIQDEISHAIVETLEVKLLGKEKKNLVKRYTDNLEAYQLYLKGRYYFDKYTPDGPAKAIECYNQALHEDPNYTLAYCGLADIYGQLAYWGFARPKDVLPKNKEYGLKAVELDDMSDEAHAVLGAIYAFTEYDWAKAEKHFQRAIKLNPSNHEAHLRYALFLTSLKRFDEARAEGNQGVSIDPLSPVAHSALVFHHFAIGELQRAIETAEQSLEVAPDFPIHHWMLWRANALLGKYDKAVEACRNTFTFWGHAEVAAAMEEVSKKSDYSAVMRKAAENMIDQSEKRYVSAHDIALFFAHAGEKENAINWLKKSFEEREPKLHMLKVMPDFSALRELPGFKDLLEKLNL